MAELEAKLAKLTAEFNAANHDKQEVRKYHREREIDFFQNRSYFRKVLLLTSIAALLADVIWLDLNRADVRVVSRSIAKTQMPYTG